MRLPPPPQQLSRPVCHPRAPHLCRALLVSVVTITITVAITTIKSHPLPLRVPGATLFPCSFSSRLGCRCCLARSSIITWRFYAKFNMNILLASHLLRVNIHLRALFSPLSQSHHVFYISDPPRTANAGSGFTGSLPTSVLEGVTAVDEGNGSGHVMPCARAFQCLTSVVFAAVRPTHTSS